MQLTLPGRRALVTGGSAGLGLAMARTFAEAGADVAIVARRPDVLESAREQVVEAAPGRAVVALVCDVRDPEQVARTYESVASQMGPPDILVNNAGTSATGRFESITDDAWQADLDLKLFAAIRFCRLAVPHMRAQRWGRVINVLNTAAKAPGAGSAPTSVSRAAGLALTKALASEYAPDNVLVNALCTGLLVTEQWTRAHERSGAGSFEQFVEGMGRRVPLGRMGDPQEFANLALFLASDAGSFVTGTAINVDGGMSPVV